MTTGRGPGRFPSSLAPLGLLPLAAIAVHAYAADYLTAGQAQKLMFPLATKFVEQPADVTAAWLRNAGARNPNEYFGGSKPKIWEARQGDALIGWFIADAVIGKFEKINYALAINADGSIHQAEVMAYRESHGQQVRERDWLAQFEGKKANAPLKLDKDIRNISDATLSCTHLTDGIRRMTLLVGSNLLR